MEVSSIILLTVIGIIMCINYYIKNKDVTYVRSSIDGRKYRVTDTVDKQECADLLADINREIIKFINYLKNDKDEKIKRICDRYNPDTFGENLDHKSYQAYSLNKGDKIVICVRDKDGNLIRDKNTMIFVMIHELAHIMTVENGHPPIFWENMNILLKKAEKAGIYNVVDYAKTPVNFCGILIDKTPYRF
tara:strand:+ start:812 stop:1381 length:570 start_codon:yes stop_codon:yes gene_type:complete